MENSASSIKDSSTTIVHGPITTRDSQPECGLLLAEPVYAEDVFQTRGNSLWRVLPEVQINMIAFSGTIGNGLFLGSGMILALAGPGGAVVAYLLMGMVVGAVISCLGEMTALMPVNAPVMEFPRRFLDRGVGFAVGWTYWFAYAVVATHNMVGAAETARYRYTDGKTNVIWEVGEKVDTAVWITVFIVLIALINLFPVKYFGMLEYVVGSVKMIFIILLIVMMVILSAMNPRKSAYYEKPLGTKYWDSPYSFFNPEYHIKNKDGSTRVIDGGLGRFLGVWNACVNVIYSYVAVDIFAATAAESRSLADSECMKMAARKITLRIIILYVLAMLTCSFLVPYNHPFLNGQAVSLATESPFVIAVVEAGLPIAGEFFNGMYLFSSFTCAVNSVYVASRVMHTLALRDQTGPEFITKRLQQCHAGVPTRAVLVTVAILALGYLGPGTGPGDRLRELSSNCTVSFLIVYGIICATYLRFYLTLQEENKLGNTAESQNGVYDRQNPRYPYKSHGQWLKACFGMVACFILLLFNGIPPFLKDPFDVRAFIVSYISHPSLSKPDMSASTRVLGAIVRRGLDVAPRKLGNQEDVDRVVFTLSFAAFIIVTVLFVGCIIAIEYIYGMVVTTLTIIEDPNPEPVVSLPSYSDAVDDGHKAVIDKKQPLGLPEAEGLPATYKPITSGFRSTIKHLRARAGRGSRFRGFSHFLALSFARGFLTNSLRFLGGFAPFVADIAVSTMVLAWVHAVISAPSSKSWYQRFPSVRKNWIKIAPAVALSTLASQLSFHIPVAIGFMLGGFRLNENGIYVLAEARPVYHLYAAGAVVLSLILGLFLDVPAAVIMVRVAASLLPADDETIVPFDRTFNGKVSPTEVDGSGAIGVLDAWRTLSWASYRRVVVAIVKVAGMLAATSFVFGIVGGLGVVLFAAGTPRNILTSLGIAA
ncbi:hypothetical protein MaudMau93_006209 [Microsporum audouinii]